MFSVFRGTKYDDIRPNHTITNKKYPKKPNEQPKTNTYGFFIFNGPDRELFDYSISTDQAVQKY